MRRLSRGARGKRNWGGRGTTKDRIRRREFMLNEFGCLVELGFWPLGHNLTMIFIRCHHCGGCLDPTEFEIDRWPICGKHGGTYRRDNIVPSCSVCNKRGRRCCA